jgi:hypothetical protein
MAFYQTNVILFLSDKTPDSAPFFHQFPTLAQKG